MQAAGRQACGESTGEAPPFLLQMEINSQRGGHKQTTGTAHNHMCVGRAAKKGESKCENIFDSLKI